MSVTMNQRAVIESFADLDIRARGRLFTVRPGRHGSRSLGGSGAFADHVSLLDHPDPRRIDVRASLADPFGTIRVRRYRQTVAARVVVILDTSGSMGASGRGDRRALAVTIAAGLARAVERSSDLFGLLTGVGSDEPFWPPRRRRGTVDEILTILSGIPFAGDGFDTLDRALDRLGTTRSIVFLISDFTQDLEKIAGRLDGLATHDLRPVVLRDSRLEAPDGRLGLVEMEDLETGRHRLVLMRPALADRWRAQAVARRAELARLFAERDVRPVEIVDAIDVEALMESIGGGGHAG